MLLQVSKKPSIIFYNAYLIVDLYDYLKNSFYS